MYKKPCLSMLVECVLYVDQCLLWEALFLTRGFFCLTWPEMMNCYTEMLIENDKYINMNINIDLYNFYVLMSVSLKATNQKRLVQKKKTILFIFMFWFQQRKEKMKLEMLLKTWSQLCCYQATKIITLDWMMFWCQDNKLLFAIWSCFSYVQ